MIREAAHADIDYFVQAGSEFCKNTFYRFDADGYSMFVHSIIKDPDSILLVTGEPVTGHAGARFIQSFYDPAQIICRVFTVWGRGGLDCFREIQRQAIEDGVDFMIADSFIEPRIMAYYEKLGMTQTDSVFIRELPHGN